MRGVDLFQSNPSPSASEVLLRAPARRCVSVDIAGARSRSSLTLRQEAFPYSESGFTLIELMVALFIFAMIAAAGVSILSFGVRAQAAAAQRLEDTADLRRFSTLLASDLAQALPRLSRAPDGQPLRAFTGNDGRSDRLVMGYVRGGWTNPEGAMRAGIQRVDVTLDEGRLTRTAYPMVDGSAAPAGIVLADKVASVTMRYRDERGEWRPRWDNALVASMPKAVEMTVMRTKAPPLTLAFIAGPSYP